MRDASSRTIDSDTRRHRSDSQTNGVVAQRTAATTSDGSTNSSMCQTVEDGNSCSEDVKQQVCTNEKKQT